MTFLEGLGSDMKCIQVWDLGTGACVAKCCGHTDEVGHVVVCDNGRTIYSGSLDTNIKVWC